MNQRVHWYSLINSLMLLVFLTIIVGIIIARTLNKDIAVYNDDTMRLVRLSLGIN